MNVLSAVITASLKAISTLPLGMRVGLGKFIAKIALKSNSNLKRIATININLCYPHFSPGQRQALINASVTETCITAIDLACVWSHAPRITLKRVTQVHGFEAVSTHLSQQQGLILICPHLSNWEMANLFLAAKLPMTIMYKPPKMRALEPIIKSARERLGTEMVPTDAVGVRTMFKRLKEGKVIGFLPDQDPGENGGEFVPFYGIPTLTMSLVSKLAIKSKAPVFMVYVIRQANYKNYELYFSPVHKAIYETDLKKSITTMNQALENAIKACPQQYQWTYKRFKRRPPGEKDFYACN